VSERAKTRVVSAQDRAQVRAMALARIAESLGPPENWPHSLSSLVNACLDSPFPLALHWGSEYILIYNDAWAPYAGDKHPWALGQPGREVWPEIWDIIGPQFEAVRTHDDGIWSEDRL